MTHLAWLAIGAYSFYVTNSSGLLRTADSDYYMTVAHALGSHQGFSHNGRYWTVFAPLYPLVLSLPGPSWPPLLFAPLLHAALFGMIMFASSLFQEYRTRGTFVINLLFPLMVLVSPIFGVTSYLWTEALYIILTTLMLILLSWHRSRVSWTWLLALGIVTGLAPIVRYIGVVNILTATACLALLFTGRWWTKLLKCLAFGISTAIPLATWCLRNYAIDGTLFGVRPPANNPITENLYRSWIAFSDWFVLAHDKHLTVLWIVVPMTLYATLQVRASIPWRKCLPLLLFVGLYVAFLNISASKHVLDPIDTRLLSPIYIPLLFLLSLLVKTTVTSAPKTTQTLMLTALISIVLSNFLNFGKMYYDLPQHRHDLVCRYNYCAPPSANCPPRSPPLR
jgi:hypothetical protein